MITSPTGRAFVKKWEGLELVSKDDGFGNPTVGWGHLGVPLGTRITQEQAEAYLTEDLGVAEHEVLTDVQVPLTQGQFDVLVSFTMNLGVGSLHNSTLLRELNQGNYADVPTQLMRWDHVGPKEVTGLKNRRTDEANEWVATSAPLNPIQPDGSRTVNGGTIAGAGGAVIVADQVTQAVSDAQFQWNSGTTIGIIIGFIILAAGIWAVYARLDDAGMIPWNRKQH